VPRKRAAELIGVTYNTAGDWDTGVKAMRDRRVYPDGRVVYYNTGVTIFDPTAVSPSPHRDGAGSVALNALEAELHPRFLTLSERETIADLRREGSSLRAIAGVLGRAPSTIKRELDAHSVDGRYHAYSAHRAWAASRPRPKQPKLARPGQLRDYVEEKLALKWSPEQISHRLIEDFPDETDMRVCHETIYQALYFQARGGLKPAVQAAMRTGRYRRKPHKHPDQRTPRFVDEMIMISDRPAEVEDRAVPGHWEGDLITGEKNQTAIITLVERTTRYVQLGHLPEGHTAAEVRDVLIPMIRDLPKHLRGSLTWDQGSEMAEHQRFSVATGVQVYFCDPHSPWQRGSNENTNGLLRQYFPKGTDLSVYGAEDLERVADELNGRPRKTLDWDTPAERLRGLIPTT
jgi:IS30 family transposase